MAETSPTGATLRMAETIPPRSLSERYKRRPPEDDREPEDEVEADAGLTPAVNTACFGTRIRSAHLGVERLLRPVASCRACGASSPGGREGTDSSLVPPRRRQGDGLILIWMRPVTGSAGSSKRANRLLTQRLPEVN